MQGPHKVECKYLNSTSAAGRDLLLHQTRLIARIIFKIKLGQGDKAEELPDGSRRSYQDLASHQVQITTDPERTMDFTLCWLQLKSFLQEESDEIYEMAQTAFCKTVINPDKMADEEDNPVACGIFLLPSAIDHSCWPNAVSFPEGRNYVTRAIDRIDSFTDVRKSYGGYELLGESIRIRRDVLKKKWYFHCECDECT